MPFDLFDSISVLLATLRGQGRGRTVIPGFAVRYISIMLPSQTRHLLCQSQMFFLSLATKLFEPYYSNKILHNLTVELLRTSSLVITETWCKSMNP